MNSAGKLEAYPTESASWKLTPRGVSFQLAIIPNNLKAAGLTNEISMVNEHELSET